MHELEIVIAIGAILASAYGALKQDLVATACGTILAAVDVLLIVVKP